MNGLQGACFSRRRPALRVSPQVRVIVSHWHTCMRPASRAVCMKSVYSNSCLWNSCGTTDRVSHARRSGQSLAGPCQLALPPWEAWRASSTAAPAPAKCSSDFPFFSLSLSNLITFCYKQQRRLCRSLRSRFFFARLQSFDVWRWRRYEKCLLVSKCHWRVLQALFLPEPENVLLLPQSVQAVQDFLAVCIFAQQKL